jgi:hypothetical protein
MVQLQVDLDTWCSFILLSLLVLFCISWPPVQLELVLDVQTDTKTTILLVLVLLVVLLVSESKSLCHTFIFIILLVLQFKNVSSINKIIQYDLFICTPINLHALPKCTPFHSTVFVPMLYCTILLTRTLHAFLSTVQLNRTYCSPFGR